MASNNVSATVRAWEDDPGVPAAGKTPIMRPRPQMDRSPLPVGIRSPAVPDPGADEVGSNEFRYWAAAEALRRGADFWGNLVPDGASWHPTVGGALMARLDEGPDLNAYYDREGLSFFHGSAGGQTVYSGESPDIVCHELGHAFLDAIRPQLWDAASAEVAAFHEAFGDMSALGCALQVESMRARVLAETRGRLGQSSSLSRLAEQLGWAIRQQAPQAVDPDCLRNASNRFFYRDPVMLPPRAPATQLSSEPHSFSRVFTGAFLRLLAGIFRAQAPDSAGLQQAATDACRLLVQGVLHAPVVPAYFSQVAAHMIAVDAELFGGRYDRVLRAAFTRTGILSPLAATSLTGENIAPHRVALAAMAPAAEPALAEVQIDGAQYGVTGSFTVLAPDQPARFSVVGAAADIGALPPVSAERTATSFVEDLFREGRVEVPAAALADEAITEEETLKTHALTGQDGGWQLVRRLFD